MTESGDHTHEETGHTLEDGNTVEVPLDAFDIALIKAALRQSDGLLRSDGDSAVAEYFGPDQEDEDWVIDDLTSHIDHFAEKENLDYELIEALLETDL